MKHIRRSARAALLFLPLMMTGAATHAEGGNSNANAREYVRFSGFGTLGAVHTRGDGAAFIRDITQPQGADNRGPSWKTDTRFGVQANFKATENVEAVAQIVSRYRWDNDFRPELTWGFIKYAPSDMLEVRAGRVSYDVYLAGDSRDAGFTYLWVRPPTEYYGTGSLLLPYQDGGDVTFRAPLGRGVARLKLHTGIARQYVSIQQGQRHWAGDLTLGPVGAIQNLSGSRMTGGFIDYQDTHWIVRYSHSNLRFARELPAANMYDIFGLMRGAATASAQQGDLAAANGLDTLIADASMLNKHLSFQSLAFAYEDGPLQTQMALSHMRSGTLVVPGSNAGYLSAGYRLGKLTPYATISAIRSKASNRADNLSPTTPAYAVSVARYMLLTGLETQHTYTLGLRYNLNSQTDLKFQWDSVRSNNCSPASPAVIGTAPPCAPPLLWPTVPVPWNGRANVLSATLDFIF